MRVVSRWEYRQRRRRPPRGVGFAVLPREKRDAICAVYAFMRYCDDIGDDPEFASDRPRLLSEWRASLDRAAGGDCSGSRILPAFSDTLTRYGIPSTYLHLLIDGVARDLEDSDYESFEDLYDYCYKVASAVGLVCIHIFGFDAPIAKTYADYMGIGFQLTNILRDIAEDASVGRVYLPMDDLWAFRYDADELVSGVIDDRYKRLMGFQVARARDFYRAGAPLMGLVHESGRPCLRAMMGIYSGILDRIEQNGYDVFHSRASLSTGRKVAIAAKALLSSRFAGGAAYGPGLRS